MYKQTEVYNGKAETIPRPWLYLICPTKMYEVKNNLCNKSISYQYQNVT